MKYVWRILFSLLFVFSSKAYSQSYCPENRFSQIALFDSSDIGMENALVYDEVYNPFSAAVESPELDLRYPLLHADPLAARPLVLLVHGGAFRSGTRKDLDEFSFELARRGYVAATMDYRLGWNCTAGDPCQHCTGDTNNLKIATYMAAQDIRSALRFLSANAVRWGIDPENVFIAGISAGSIAMFAAGSWSQQDANLFIPEAEIILGPLSESQSRLYTIRGLADICGAFPGDSTALVSLRLPVISFHDEFDCVVPYENGHLLGCGCTSFYRCSGPKLIHRFLGSQNRCSENRLVENSYNHCSTGDEVQLLQTASFFKSILCGECGTAMHEGFFVQVNPVPCDAEAVIDFSEYAHHGGTIHCMNPMGQEIYKQVYHEYDAVAILPAYSFAPGIYYLVFECSEEPAPLKMIVVHP